MMSSKCKKSALSGSSLWYLCDNCGCFISSRDLQEHQLTYCTELRNNLEFDHFNWKQSFIRDLTVHGFMEDIKSTDLCVAEKDVILVSQSVMQLCQFVIGDPVVVISKTGDGKSVSRNFEVKTVWPTKEGSVTSIFCPKQGVEMSWGLNYGPVKVTKLKYTAAPASEISFHFIKSTDIPAKLDHFIHILHYQLINKVFHSTSRVAIDFYGKKIKIEFLKIESIKYNADNDCVEDLISDMRDKLNTNLSDVSNIKAKDDSASCDSSSSVQFYQVLESTVFRLKNDNSIDKNGGDFKLGLSDIGGYKDTINELNSVMIECLKKKPDPPCNFKKVGFTKGVLLYGLHGVGKTVIAYALANSCGAHVVTIQSGDLFSKFYGEAESRLRSLFEEALANAPSVLILDDIDTICPNRGGSDQERRVIATLLTLLDSLDSPNVFILATTSQLDVVDPALRRPGRLDREIELTVPSSSDREDILMKLFRDDQLLNKDIIKRIAAIAHGYVGADLAAVVAQSYAHAAKSDNNVITARTLEWALTQVKPSAMREVLVRIPDVKWSDIGGQDRLKLQLRQAVEWPLNHPDAFTRLGITPPRGVLMFGPPGCSKTMIAKALATESKLNFISIKGPELFSKWVGESERAVRAVFKRARSVAPAIVFLDELDAIAGERGGSGGDGGGGASVQERVLAQILTELDGVEPLRNVIIIAATNRPDRIDKALLRPGRLDRLIYVPLPDLATRCQILNLQFRKIPVSPDVSIDKIASLMDGYSGAEVVAVCHEAALNALEEDKSASLVKPCHFKYALSIVTPRTPDSLLNLYEKYITRC